jgi:hypothetical protein
MTKSSDFNTVKIVAAAFVLAIIGAGIFISLKNKNVAQAPTEQPTGVLAFEGVLDSWAVKYNWIFANIKTTTGDVKKYTISFNDKTKFREALGSVLKQGAVSNIQSGTNVKIYLKRPYDADVSHAAETIVYWK